MSDPRVAQKEKEDLVQKIKDIFDQRTVDGAQTIAITSNDADIAALQGAVAALQVQRAEDRAIIDANSARLDALEVFHP